MGIEADEMVAELILDNHATITYQEFSLRTVVSCVILKCACVDPLCANLVVCRSLAYRASYEVCLLCHSSKSTIAQKGQ